MHIFHRRFLQYTRFLVVLLAGSLALQAQTDAAIFREFEFDFSTPGARANAMGRAFVGLADEASAAYSNPAGLSVLKDPELTLEGRLNSAFYQAIAANETWDITQGEPADSEFELDRMGFASYAFSLRNYNFSVFFVNHLDYRREPSDESVVLLDGERPLSLSSWRNAQDVRQIALSTTGLSLSRNFGKFSLGLSAGLMRLDMDYLYISNISNLPLSLSNRVRSEANLTDERASHKPAWVLGALYQPHSKLKLGFSYKRHPRFSYTESLVSTEFPGGMEVPVTFKVPDAVQLGLALQPNDLWTLLLDVDWTRYRQTLGDNMTLLSGTSVFGSIFRFERADFTVKERPNYRLGAEYLQPVGRNIIALRWGAFLDAEHKTRFRGQPPEESSGNDILDQAVDIIYATQDFLYNAGDNKDNFGYTAGIGFVWQNDLQFDAAFIRSDRYNRAVCSLLYRF